MKQKTVMVAVLAVVVVGIIGFLVNSNIKNNKQGAAVAMSQKGSDEMSKTAENIKALFESSPSLNAAFRVNPDQVKSEVDLSKVTKDTKPFSMQISAASPDGTTIGPVYTLINCGEWGQDTTACCDTNSNTMYFYDRNGDYAHERLGGCIDSEWDRI